MAECIFNCQTVLHFAKQNKKEMLVYKKQNKEMKETRSSEKNETRVVWRVPGFISLVTVKNN